MPVDSLDGKLATKVEPYTYTLWKEGVTEPIIYISQRKVNIENGKSMYVSLQRNKRPSPLAIPPWEFIAIDETPEKGDWKFALKANGDGGFQITKDQHTNLAPERGYQNQLVIQQSDMKNRTMSPSGVKVYFKSSGGKAYATFRLHYVSYGAGASLISLDDLRVNPNGSRILEYDESREILD